jgi:hypothetical protein
MALVLGKKLRIDRVLTADRSSAFTSRDNHCHHPRTQVWLDHFYQEKSEIHGKTPEGRTTENLLKFNTQNRIRERL